MYKRQAKGEGIVRFWKGGVRQGGGCGFERVVGMERLVGVKQSLRLDGRKV